MKVVGEEKLINLTSQLSEKQLGTSIVLNGSLEIFDTDRQKRKGSLGGKGSEGGTKPRANTDPKANDEGIDPPEQQKKINFENILRMRSRLGSQGGESPPVRSPSSVPTFEQFGKPSPAASMSSSSASSTDRAERIDCVFDSMDTAEDEARNKKVAGAGLFPMPPIMRASMATDIDRETLSRSRAFSLTSTRDGLDVNNLQERELVSRSRSGTMEMNETTRSRSGSLALGDGDLREDLINILETTWDEYDFANASPTAFIKHEDKKAKAQAVQKINGYLASLTEGNQNFLSDLWDAINESIVFAMTDEKVACDLYSYEPDEKDNGDPFQEAGVTWSFNYFFHNRDTKKVLYFTCTAKRLALQTEGYDEEEGEGDGEGEGEGEGEDSERSDFYISGSEASLSPYR